MSTFWPLPSKTIRLAGRIRFMAPVFLRYLFVAFDLTRDRWRAINGTHGVSTLLWQRVRSDNIEVNNLWRDKNNGQGKVTFGPQEYSGRFPAESDSRFARKAFP
jgi:transcription antitermination factor NusG